MIGAIEFFLVAICQFLAIRICVNEVGLGTYGLYVLATSLLQISRFLEIGLPTICTRELASCEASKQSYVGGVIYSFSIAYYTTTTLLVSISIWLFNGEFATGHPQLLLVTGATLFFQSLTAISHSALLAINMQRSKSIIGACSSILGLSVSAALIPRHGVLGYAIGQMIQYASSFCMSSWSFWRTAGGKLLHADTPNRNTVKIFRGGTQLQLSGLLWALLDIGVRLNVNHSSGTHSLAIYEIANRLCSQARILCLYMVQPALPSLISALQNSRDSARELLQSRVSSFNFIALILYTVLLLAMAPYGAVMLGRLSNEFLLIYLLLATASALQVMAIPYEHFGIATKRMRPNIYGSLIGLSMLGLTFLFNEDLRPGGYALSLLSFPIASLLIIVWSPIHHRIAISRIQLSKTAAISFIKTGK